MKKKIIVLLAVIILLIIGALGAFLFIGNPKVFSNNKKLKDSLLSLDLNKDISLKEAIPFEFDTLYTFDPYTSKEDIELIIGFKSNSIKEISSEGMVQLLFVKNNKVVASICDYSVNLGYKIVNFGNRAYPETVFSVYKENKIVILDGNLTDEPAMKQITADEIEQNAKETKEEEILEDEDEVLKPTKVKPKTDNKEEIDEALEETKEEDIENNEQEDKNTEDDIKIETITAADKEETIEEIKEEVVDTPPAQEIIIITPDQVNSEVPKNTSLSGTVFYENIENGVLHTYHLLDDGTYMCDGVVYNYTLSYDDFENVDEHYKYLVLTNNKNLTSSEFAVNYSMHQDTPNSILVERVEID